MHQSSNHDPFYHTIPPPPHHRSSPPPPPPHSHHLHEVFFDNIINNSTSSHDFFSPPSSYSPFLQRSCSSVSLYQNRYQFEHGGGDGTNGNQPMFEQQQALFDSQQAAAGTMRRVFSTGDLQPFGENCIQESGTVVAACAATRIGRYNAEERRERIERYRSKRNHRNFQKKITYACRKTLADSRPRVRGRFARNGEPDAEADAENVESMMCYNNGGGDGGACCDWRQTATTKEDCCYGGGELWTDFLDDFSINNLIS